MKQILWVAAFMLLFIPNAFAHKAHQQQAADTTAASAIVDSPSETPAVEGVSAADWACPMHPQIRQEKPGKCPVCGMDLIRAASEQDHQAVEDSAKTVTHVESKLTRTQRLIAYAGRFHPVVVHFPIALMIAALAAEVLFILTGAAIFAQSARFCLLGGAGMAIVAAALGLADAAFASFTGEDAAILGTHRWLGLSAGTLSFLTALAGEWAYRQPTARRIYLALLFVSVALVGLAGHFGAMLIYGGDHFSLKGVF